MTVLRIGIATSPLAQAQSMRIQNALAEYVPNLRFEFIAIANDTLTQALATKEIDCFVSNYKTQPYEALAVLPRSNPRDIAVFNAHILEKLRNALPVTIGTSSTLHDTNVIPFLKNVLPHPPVDIVIKNLSYNLFENLARLDSDCDGIILAVADVNDAAQDAKVKKGLENRLFMMLPLSECPTAPGQGALALYGRPDDNDLKTTLTALHDNSAAQHIEREYAAFNLHGVKTGATSISTTHFPDHILFVKNDRTKSVTWPDMPQELHGQAWDGADKRGTGSQTVILPIAQDAIHASAVFVTHSRAATPAVVPALSDKTLWTSGVQSWKRLAAQGLWVQGCTEELGVAILKDAITQNSFLNLPAMDQWQILTHEGTRNEWPAGQIVATYSVGTLFDPSTAAEVTKAAHIFWSSASQYELYKDYAAKNCYHYCRAGKTADILKSCNLSPLTVYPNLETWRQCLNETL